VVFISGELGSKRLELTAPVHSEGKNNCHARTPETRPETEAEREEIQVAAQTMGLSLIILDVTSGGDI